jgi:hypothetical protein
VSACFWFRLREYVKEHAVTMQATGMNIGKIGGLGLCLPFLAYRASDHWPHSSCML